MSVLRADARRNLDRILAAAADLYAEVGPDVTIDEIAHRAGVGHGTVCRRFPTKEALRGAVLVARLEEMRARAEELLAHPDAGAALDEFVWFAAGCCRRDRSLFEGAEQCGALPLVEAKLELRETVDKLIRRARKAGAVRRGLDARDLGALVGAAVHASQFAERDDAWRRYVSVLLHGLHP
jgi:AcrR family transcriptional regulator